MKTGWPPGLLQDDDRKLSRWLASRPDARYQLRKNIMNKDTGGPAFPTKNYKAVVPEATGYAEGMTLRDYFAAKAMQEYCKEFHDDAYLAKVAYQIADAMLKARGQA